MYPQPRRKASSPAAPSRTARSIVLWFSASRPALWPPRLMAALIWPLTLGALPAAAQVEGPWRFSVGGGSVTVTGYSGADTNVVVPEILGGFPVTRIGGPQVLQGPASFFTRNLTLPASVTNIATGAFANAGLTNLTILGPVQAIPDGMCFYAQRLASVTLPDTVTTIGRDAFASCSQLAGIALPDGLTSIGDGAFANCSRLLDVSLPAGLTWIGPRAFWFCSSLKPNQGRLTIPAAVTTIGDRAFRGCAQLEAFEVDPLNTSFTSRDGVLFNQAQTTLWAYPRGRPGNYQIPDGVRIIGVTAFAGAAFTSLTIPASVTSIQERAFESCDQLAALVIPDTVTTLGLACFQNCRQLASVRVGRGLTTLPANVFSACTNLSSVHLPDTLRTISDLAFFQCLALRSIVIPASVRTLGTGVFEPQFYSDDPVGLASIYFEGNRPAAGPQALVNQPFEHGPTVYYRAGTTGWLEEFAGRPTALWDPQVAFEAAFGVKEGKMGFTLTGAPGLVIVVEASMTLTSPIWAVLGTLTLTGGRAEFQDPAGADGVARFYRFRSPL